MKKKIILGVIGALVVGIVVYNIVKKEEAKFTLFEVKRGNVVEEVSETGQVKVGEEINLNFKNSGTIQSVYVKVGDDVLAGTSLVKLNTAELSIQLQEAQASLEVAQAKYNQLLAGSSAEEIKVAQTALDNAQQALLDVKAEAEDDLSQAYEDALVVLDGSYNKGNISLNTVSTIQQTYFYGNDQESTTVKAKKTAIEGALAGAKIEIDAAKISLAQTDIDAALSGLKDSLSTIYEALVVIRDTAETITYRNIVSSTNKTSLDTEKTNINTALTNVANSQQTISSTKIANEKAINDALGNVKEAEDNLALKTASPRPTDIALYQAQVNQAQAQVDLLRNQIWDSTLRSPVKGKVTAINKELGELVQPSSVEAVLTILPANPYGIEVEIYEEDVVKVKTGDEVEIKLTAFPGEVFGGRVISIDPVEKLVEDIVYYKVMTDFENPPAGLKPGMSADITIKTARKDNVLVIMQAAIEKQNGKSFVNVLKDEKLESREITTGLQSTDGMVEVLSGLAEGEKIAVSD
jgi:HlyD family secretion protein